MPIEKMTNSTMDHSLQETEAILLQQKMDELIKETNQFTYIITHDLQAPLRMITGFLELIEKRYRMQLDDAGKQYIDYAIKGSVKMKALIFDLLEYSRISSVAQLPEEVDLTAILATVKEGLATDIYNTSAQIVAEPLPVIRADKRLMGLLFHHILDNAIKFRSTVPPEIRITVCKEAGGWQLCFQDNGIGIDPAFLEKIFVIFRRLQTDEVRFPGTGTGLAICRKIMALHGGRIVAESMPGKGLLLKVWFPECSDYC